MVYTGFVQIYDVARHFGFVHPVDREGLPCGERIFFHIRRGFYPIIGESLKVEFGSSKERGFQQLRTPRVGDRIVFDIDPVQNEAKPWTYEELWLDEHRFLAGRSNGVPPVVFSH